MRKALITGLTGQDGSHLADLLLSKDYEVHGIIRRTSVVSTARISHLTSAVKEGRLVLHEADLQDAGSLRRAMAIARPDEIYNLGAMTHVRTSFDNPVYTFDVVANGTLRLLEVMRDLAPAARFYQASSSEQFGSAPPPQNEKTPFHPRSPYGCSKTAAHYIAVNYREAYKMHISCGLLMNHEGPRRGENFVTRKITRAATRIKLGLQKELRLGNLDAKRDWGAAEDFVQAMYLMLQQPAPDDYVVATGESHTVREFLETAFELLDLDWEKYVSIDPIHYRPSEVDELRGDARKARRILGWEPKIGFRELIRQMVESDMKLAASEVR